MKSMLAAPKKRLINCLRILTSLLLLFLFYYLADTPKLPEAISSDLPVLYSNVCQDDLETLFLQAIRESNHSIFLMIYSLSDEKLIRALNAQAEKGCTVHIAYDKTTPAYGLKNLSEHVYSQGIKLSGLMHKKILIIDEEKIFIGSANMTPESLKVHDNLVVGLINPQLAQALVQKKGYFIAQCGNQQVEYWDFPEQGEQGLYKIIQLIDKARHSLRIAMFTWTHSQLTQAVIRAHNRGVRVEIILDQGQANGVCQTALKTLLHAGVDVHVSSCLGLLHHKFAWIDESYLINGSANWTNAAFTRNQDCILILYPLTDAQNEKMRSLWKKTKRTQTPIPLAA